MSFAVTAKKFLTKSEVYSRNFKNLAALIKFINVVPCEYGLGKSVPFLSGAKNIQLE